MSMIDQTHDAVASSLGYVTSFEAFFRARSEDVYRALFASVGDADLAEEATAEAFARAYGRWDRVRAYSNPSGWVYRVGLNWATSRLRRRRFRHRGPVPEMTMTDPEPMDPGLVDRVRRLSRPHLEVIVLRYFFDLDQKSIADLLGVPVGTVRSRLSRALAVLERELEGESE